MDEPGDLELVVTSGLFSLRGRSDRRAFIATTLTLLVITYIAGGVLCVSLASLDAPLPPEDVPAFLASLRVPVAVAWIGAGLGLLCVLAVLIGSLAVSVRRLHDAGQSGLLVLLFFVLPPVMASIAWSSFLPAPSYLIWNAIMIALPGARAAAVDPVDAGQS